MRAWQVGRPPGAPLVRLARQMALLLPWSVGIGSAMAQSTGTLHLRIDPEHTFEFILDHRYRQQRHQLELSAGTHHFSFWAPQRTIVDTTIIVEADRTISFALRLPYAPEYLAYRRELDQYHMRRRFARITPAVATGGMLLYTLLKYNRAQQALDQLEVDRQEYARLGSPYRITVLKEQTIPADKEAFRKAKVQLGVSAGILLLSAGITAYVFQKSGKVQRPEFIDKEKLRFEGLSWVPGPDGGIWQGGLTWNLGR